MSAFPSPALPVSNAQAYLKSTLAQKDKTKPGQVGAQPIDLAAALLPPPPTSCIRNSNGGKKDPLFETWQRPSLCHRALVCRPPARQEQPPGHAQAGLSRSPRAGPQQHPEFAP